MNRAVLAVDIGTSSLKAAIIDIKGNALAASRCRFPETRRSCVDWALALADAVTILSPLPELAAVSISGNGPTLASVDPGGNPGPTLLWNEPVRGAYGGKSLFIPRLLEFRDRWPAEWDAARHVLSGPEWLMWALTGEAVTVLPERRFETAYWTIPELAEAGLDGSRLAPWVDAGTVIGRTGTGPYSPRIPLPAGIPVVAGGPDFYVALVGTATVEPGTACDRAGTSEGLNACTSTPTPAPGVRILPGALGGLWNAACLLPDTGAAFHEWRKSSGQSGRPYPEIMREILASDIRPRHGEAPHPGRLLVEDIGFSVREAGERLAAATGFNPAWRLSGGQARNALWNRMKADMTGFAFELTGTPDGELMGDAILGFTATGGYGDVREACRAMVRVAERYEPDPGLLAEYSEKYLEWKDAR